MEEIQNLAKQVFGDIAKAEAWLSQPRARFGGVPALELTRDSAGFVKVKEELERIEHGFGC
ncbi:DUF2384 domain-containing protein [Pseudomonas donghuensis]|nr:DUF2384 domain-containing protein [Pseudomonas donghuensis]